MGAWGVNGEAHLEKRKTSMLAAQTRCRVVPDEAGTEGSVHTLLGCPGRTDDVSLHPRRSQELGEFETEAWYEPGSSLKRMVHIAVREGTDGQRGNATAVKCLEWR